MAIDSNVAPVIIKKKRIVQADGHHGGAWKVAYADFVTAMMAFFMLMWLLNATTEKQRKGLADYFSPTVSVSRMSSGSDGMFMGDSVFSEDVLPQTATGAMQDNPASDDTASGGISSGADRTSEVDEAAFRKIENMLRGMSGESMVADMFLDHITSKVTDEGLVYELFDSPTHNLFNARNEPTDRLRELARYLIDASKDVPNKVAIEGHVATFPVVRREDPAWEWSSERAFAFADLMESLGFEGERAQRITAHGDRDPETRNPMALRNNRVKLIFLRS